MNHVEVDLEPGLENYSLPESPGSAEEMAEAIRKSWDFLYVAPLRITAPLLAAAYSAPLSEIIAPDFVIWLRGGTGSFKSTLAALVLCHYGSFSEYDLPLSFESTSNALERSLFLAKDTLTVVDDWRPGVTRADSDEMDRKAQRLLRSVGNRQGRSRMTSDTKLRGSYPPRGMIMVTAEGLPEGPAFQSAAARALSIDIARDQVDLRKLSDLQSHRDQLSSSMAGYIRYVAERYDDLLVDLPGQRDSIRDAELRSLLAGSHPRTPGNAATLITGLQQFRDYSVSVGPMDEAEIEKRSQQAREAIVEAARAHTEATSGGDPASRFIEILRSLFAANRVYVNDRETGDEPDDCLQLGWEEHNNYKEDEERAVYVPHREADSIGWVDEEYLYLNSDAAYAAVAGFAQRGNIPFGIKPSKLWDSLAKAGVSMTDEGRSNTTAKIKGKTMRVIQLRRSSLAHHDLA